MTLEVRIAFLLFFFALWCLLGFLPWTVAALLRRGRDVLLALPLALTGGAAAGVLVPLLGLRDALGFLVSLPAALGGGAIATAAGVALALRLGAARAAREGPGE